jgi:5-methylcytosine-specific restriction endonuclease McrA
MKFCKKCSTEKPSSEFSKATREKDGLQPKCKSCDADYRRVNSAKIKEYIAIYRSENALKIGEVVREYQAVHKDRLSEKRDEYYIVNKPSILEKMRAYHSENKDRIADQHKQYRSANKALIANHARRRRAKVKGAEGSHTADDVLKILESQRRRCATCNKKLSDSGKAKYHIDHVMPLSKGGTNWPSNLQMLCPSCNLKKNDKDPLDWANQNGKLL